jgi:hypothetical protein
MAYCRMSSLIPCPTRSFSGRPRCEATVGSCRCSAAGGCDPCDWAHWTELLHQGAMNPAATGNRMHRALLVPGSPVEHGPGHQVSTFEDSAARMI